MEEAEKQGMTNGEFAFIYLDLYNTNTSYVWTDHDDHLDNSTSEKDDTDYNSEHHVCWNRPNCCFKVK